MVWPTGHLLQNGKYTIEDVLGQGGFGITYKAFHTRLKQHVVIKTPNDYLKYDSDYEQYVQRFIKEGQRLAQLSQNPHPHIVRVWDLFEEGEIPCMVMDFVPGENLFQLVRRRGALPEAEIVPCIRQIGEALSVIHQAGLVHRDAHPGNIIVRPDARAILIDFGIAKELIPSTQSSTGEAGNRGFAPYEQISRGSREPTVDIYCLAATLYFAVTGERPVTSLDRRLHDAILIAPSRYKPNLSERLNQAILEGMALEPGVRPQSMRSWLDLLQEPIVQPIDEHVPTTGQSQPANAISNNQESSNFGNYFQISSRKAPKIPTRRKTSKTSTQHIQNSSARRRTGKIPWGSLAFVLVIYLFLGILLASAPIWFVAMTIAGAVVVAVAVVMMVEVSVIMTWFWVVVGAVAGIGAVVEVWTWATVVQATGGALAVAMANAIGGGAADAAKYPLLKSFNRLQTFLILTGTSLIGFSLGWLVGVVSESPVPQTGML